MSNLTKKLWKVADAVEQQATTIKGDSMEELKNLLKSKKSLVVFVGLVVVLVIGNWLGL